MKILLRPRKQNPEPALGNTPTVPWFRPGNVRPAVFNSTGAAEVVRGDKLVVQRNLIRQLKKSIESSVGT